MFGTIWDDNSCAYDAVITILYNLWLNNPIYWSSAFTNIGSHIILFLDVNFHEVLNNSLTLDSVRDGFRELLCLSYRLHFRFGQFTSVDQILLYTLASHYNVLSSSTSCPHLHVVNGPEAPIKNCYVSIAGVAGNNIPLISILNNCTTECVNECGACGYQLIRTYKLITAPPILFVDTSMYAVDITTQVIVNVGGQNHMYKLHSIIYFGNYHFTCVVIDSANKMWFHDGMKGKNMYYICNLSENLNLRVFNNQVAVAITLVHIN
ncbi:hypothetical protein BDN72DRAFT_781231 [Pluteus cervinus]|uniref:Uncharacterized protein n=1 Tax=Pluteus cervinus TaxID=181527 RepID=A0ACD3A1A7_9AGAR|nr:hypothetical protein BDN72DRAFT_781231 [Pluteus cervinus]